MGYVCGNGLCDAVLIRLASLPPRKVSLSHGTGFDGTTSVKGSSVYGPGIASARAAKAMVASGLRDQRR